MPLLGIWAVAPSMRRPPQCALVVPHQPHWLQHSARLAQTPLPLLPLPQVPLGAGATVPGLVPGTGPEPVPVMRMSAARTAGQGRASASDTEAILREKGILMTVRAREGRGRMAGACRGV